MSRTTVPADTPVFWTPDPALPVLPRTAVAAGAQIAIRPVTNEPPATDDFHPIAPRLDLPLPPPELPAMDGLAELSPLLEQTGWPRLDDASRLKQPVPFYLGTSDEDGSNRFSAWWHPADPAAPLATARLGVVLCSALGRDEMCSHAALRDLAGQLAAAGVSAIRFDYPCTGDAGGEDLDPQAPQRWLKAIDTATDTLRQLGGVQRLVLFGLRAGSLLAAQVAEQRSDVAGMIAWMPVLSGRQYLREARLLAGEQADAAEGIFESGGFALSAHATSVLQGWDTRRLTPGRQPWLVLERDDLDDALLTGWLDKLRAASASMQHARPAGYAQLMFDPHHSHTPPAWCEATLAWLRDLATPEQLPPISAPPPLQRHTQPGLEWRSAGVREHHVRIRAGETLLYGVLTEPQRDEDRQPRTVLLINSGAVRRAGPGRLYVLLARRLARAGHTVLRLDLAGLGESAPLPGQPLRVVYTEAAVPQVLAAVQFLQRHQPGSAAEVMGICAGAYHALQAALTCARLQAGSGEPRLDGPPGVRGIGGVLAINPLTYNKPEILPPPGSGPSLSAQQAAGEMARYRAGIWSAQRWRRLLRGEVNLLNPLRVIKRQARSRLLSRWRDALRTVGHARPDDVGQILTQVARSGVRLGFVFSESDPGAALLQLEAGSRLRALRRARMLHWFDMPGADHTFTRLSAREDLLDLVLRWCHTPRG